MTDSKMKFGVHGIWALLKFHFAESMRVGSLLVLSLSLGCAASVRAAEAGSDNTAGPNSTNYASFQSVVRDQMHGSAELPAEASQEPLANHWNDLIITVEVAVCLTLCFRLFAPRIDKFLNRDLDAVSATTGSKPQSLKRKM